MLGLFDNMEMLKRKEFYTFLQAMDKQHSRGQLQFTAHLSFSHTLQGTMQATLIRVEGLNYRQKYPWCAPIWAG